MFYHVNSVVTGLLSKKTCNSLWYFTRVHENPEKGLGLDLPKYENNQTDFLVENGLVSQATILDKTVETIVFL